MTTNYYLVNLTPHTVNVMGLISSPIQSSGVARCDEITTPEPDIQHDYHGDAGMHVPVALVRKRYGNVTGLPDPRLHTLYIVSTIVQQACPGRDDLVAPHDIVRDAEGVIVGCRGFSRLDR